MDFGDFLLSVTGPLLVCVILWRCLRLQLWRHYPFFYTYVSYVLVLGVFHMALVDFRFPGYALMYWIGDAIASFLWFAVTWEVLRHVFPSDRPMRRVVGPILVLSSIALAVTVYFGSENRGSIFLDLERKSSLAQASLIVVSLLVARYYAIPLGRNVWGMALGFGIFVSVTIMNLAAFDLFESFVPYWRLIRPTSFIGMLAVWTWALWSYAPNPQPAPTQIQDLERRLAEWNNAWHRMRATLLRVIGL